MNIAESMGTCNARQARKFIIECLDAGLVPFLKSSPGIGKSSIFRQIAREYNLFIIDHRLSTSAPEDLSGLPRFTDDGMAEFAPFTELFPIESTALPDGHNGWLIFLDEFNACDRGVQAAAYKLILDKMTGQKHLHPLSVIGCAGNHDTDRSITNPISTAMQSRVIHIHLEVDHKCWLEDVAIPEKYDYRIMAYLNQYPKKLMDFRPDHNDKTFCCPRTWEFMNKLIKDKPVTADRIPLYGGTITSGIAAEFVTFVDSIKDMITIKDILLDPEKAPLPNTLEGKWVAITLMGENATEENFPGLAIYATRFALDFKVLFFRIVIANQPELRLHPAMRDAFVELSRYLND